MPDSSVATVGFLSWVRQGLAASIGGGALEIADGHVSLPITLRVNGTALSTVPVQLFGPGDVIGIDAREIVRTDPQHLSATFEPNYLPCVEFDHPDFPWMLTPAAANANGQLQPWVCLIVVSKDTSSFTSDPAKPLPVLECAQQELPNLADAWAWAHAQVVTGGSVATTSDALAAPDRSMSRLLCARRLDAGTSYYACVVPTFEVGRKAGLGESFTADDEKALRPAWTPPASGAPPARIQLPVYYHWEFSTGAEGDFEALARRLQRRDLPGSVGIYEADVSTPGWGVGPFAATAAGSMIQVEGALRIAGTKAKPWSDDVRVPFQTALRNVLDAGAKVAAPGGAPSLVGPPLYGQWYPRLERLPAAGSPPMWFSELNLDVQFRIAAGLGGEIVRYNQEALMASAWDQLAEHDIDTTETKRAQFAEAVGQTLSAKIAGTSATATPAPSQAVADIPRFAPSFQQPAYELLRDFFPDMLLPGLDRLPANSITLLETNPRFVEAFLVGLNHEMSRELLWRDYPADRRGTYFRQFWDVSADITPIDSWAPSSHLGDHAPVQAATSMIVLALRGDLLNRYPRAIVYAVEAGWSSTAVNANRTLGTKELYPMFRITRAPDITMLAFGITAQQARGADRPSAAGTAPSADAGWFFVLQEQPTEPRFGLDEASDGAFGTKPATWSDLSWAHVAASAAALKQLVYLPIGGALTGTTIGNATWGKNAAHVASIVRQRPFRLAVHARMWLDS